MSTGAALLDALKTFGPLLAPHVKDWLDGKPVDAPPELREVPDVLRSTLELEAYEARARAAEAAAGKG